MTIPSSIVAAGAEPSDDPLQTLAACHARIASMCEKLRHLMLQIQQQGGDADARQHAGALLRFFDDVVPRHHREETEDLFPALLESMAGSDAVCLRQITSGLAREYRTLEIAWQRCLRPALQGLADGDSASRLDAHEVEAFISQHLAHIRLESTELLPMAQRLLGDEELARMRAAMAARRSAGL